MGMSLITENPVSLEAATAVLGGMKLPEQHFYLRLIQHEPSNTWFMAMPYTGYLKPANVDNADEYVAEYNQDFGTLSEGWSKFETLTDRKGFKSVYLVYSNPTVKDVLKRRLEAY